MECDRSTQERVAHPSDLSTVLVPPRRAFARLGRSGCASEQLKDKALTAPRNSSPTGPSDNAIQKISEPEAMSNARRNLAVLSAMWRRKALPGCGHAERALQASWWQEHGKEKTTDIPLPSPAIAVLTLEATSRNLDIAELIGQVWVAAITKICSQDIALMILLRHSWRLRELCGDNCSRYSLSAL
jgi:hypothetical protein